MNLISWFNCTGLGARLSADDSGCLPKMYNYILSLPIQWQPPLDFGVFIQGPDRCTVQAPNFQILGKRKILKVCSQIRRLCKLSRMHKACCRVTANLTSSGVWFGAGVQRRWQNGWCIASCSAGVLRMAVAVPEMDGCQDATSPQTPWKPWCKLCLQCYPQEMRGLAVHMHVHVWLPPSECLEKCSKSDQNGQVLPLVSSSSCQSRAFTSSALRTCNNRWSQQKETTESKVNLALK